MSSVEGVASRFFFNPMMGVAMLRLKGQEHVRFITVPPQWADCDSFVMTRPGDKVRFELESEVLEGWFNETYVIDLT